LYLLLIGHHVAGWELGGMAATVIVDRWLIIGNAARPRLGHGVIAGLAGRKACIGTTDVVKVEPRQFMLVGPGPSLGTANVVGDQAEQRRLGFLVDSHRAFLHQRVQLPVHR
jgi:hypothetical protein